MAWINSLDVNKIKIIRQKSNTHKLDLYKVSSTKIYNLDSYASVESINSFMHVAHDKNVLCDSYIVNFIHGGSGRRQQIGFLLPTDS